MIVRNTSDTHTSHRQAAGQVHEQAEEVSANPLHAFAYGSFRPSDAVVAQGVGQGEKKYGPLERQPFRPTEVECVITNSR